MTKLISFTVIVIIYLSCNNQQQVNVASPDEITDQITKAKTNTVSFKGKFIKIEKLDKRNYVLSLKGEHDSLLRFITMMPLSENDIALLRENGDNIELSYNEYYNPITKSIDKVVKYMHPIYDLTKIK